MRVIHVRDIHGMFKNVDNRVTNYRGIALQPILSKALERCVHSRILNLIEPDLSPSQHGFRRYRSCVTQLLCYVHKLATSLDAGEQIDNVYLNMEKAFDRVPHEKPLYKLEYLGIANLANLANLHLLRLEICIF